MNNSRPRALCMKYSLRVDFNFSIHHDEMWQKSSFSAQCLIFNIFTGGCLPSRLRVDKLFIIVCNFYPCFSGINSNHTKSFSVGGRSSIQVTVMDVVRVLKKYLVLND